MVLGLPHEMPHLPAHSNDTPGGQQSKGSTKLIDLSDLRTRLAPVTTAANKETVPSLKNM